MPDHGAAGGVNERTKFFLFKPSQLETIDDHAFSGCTNLQFDFSKHPRLTTIGDNACCGVNFTAVAFPPSLESIGVSAFMNCRILTQVTFPPNSKLVYIKRGAFSNTGIESFHVPPGVTQLAQQVVADCTSLLTIHLNHIEIIHAGACRNTALRTVTIPASVNRIEDDAFCDCIDLTTLTMQGITGSNGLTMQGITGSNGLTMQGITGSNGLTMQGITGSNGLTMQGITGSNGLTMQGITGSNGLTMQGITGSNGLTMQGITGSNGLTMQGITGSNGLTMQGITGSNGLTMQGITDSVLTHIGKRAFKHTKLTQVYIPASVDLVDREAFMGCECLTTIRIPENSGLKHLGEGVWAYTAIGSLYIPRRVKTLPARMCDGCDQLAVVAFSAESTITTIKKYAFNKCTALLQASLPASVKTIGEYAFCDCLALTQLHTLPQSRVTAIQAHTFDGCMHLSTFPAFPLLADIGPHAFNGCNFEYVFIPKHVVRLANNCFETCNNLTLVEFAPDSQLKFIEADALGECELSRLSIPSSVAYIDVSALDVRNIGCILVQNKSRQDLIMDCFTQDERENNVTITVMCNPAHIPDISNLDSDSDSDFDTDLPNLQHECPYKQDASAWAVVGANIKNRRPESPHDKTVYEFMQRCEHCMFDFLKIKEMYTIVYNSGI